MIGQELVLVVWLFVGGGFVSVVLVSLSLTFLSLPLSNNDNTPHGSMTATIVMMSAA